MRKLNTFAQKGDLKDPAIMENIVDTLFPEHPIRPKRKEKQTVGEIELFTEAELTKAVLSMQNNKAPGSDGLPAELLKAVTKSHSHLLLNVYNSCLEEGMFPDIWKVARLVLLNKGKELTEGPTSYRPLCMLDVAGKILEKLIKSRLTEAIKKSGDLHERQFGFRKGKSTIGAILEIVNAAKSTEKGNHYSRPMCLLITLDVKNAFNSVR